MRTLHTSCTRKHTIVKTHVKKGKGVLAGNTVHMDRRFLDKYMPSFSGYLHYRLVDVSTVRASLL